MKEVVVEVVGVVVVVVVVVVLVFVGIQQSASVTPNPTQLSRPHVRFPEHSASESQSPSLRLQGLADVQHS